MRSISRIAALALVAVTLSGCPSGTPNADRSPSPSATSPPPSGVPSSPSSSASTVPSPKPSPTQRRAFRAPRYVAISSFTPGEFGTAVSLIDMNGRRVAKHEEHLSSVSTTDTRAYFLVGDSTVKFLQPDGRIGVVAPIPTMKDQTFSSIAVSPDDSLVAYQLVAERGGDGVGDGDLTGSEAEIGVQNLNGTDRRTIARFRDGAAARKTVAWHDGWIALGTEAGGYELLDPASGARYGSLCRGGGRRALEHLVYAGVMCWKPSTGPIGFAGWTAGFVGFTSDKRAINPCQASMRGRALLCADPSERASYFIRRDGSIRTIDELDWPIGWIDDERLVIARGGKSAYLLTPSTKTYQPINSIEVTNQNNYNAGFVWGGTIPANT